MSNETSSPHAAIEKYKIEEAFASVVEPSRTATVRPSAHWATLFLAYAKLTDTRPMSLGCRGCYNRVYNSLRQYLETGSIPDNTSVLTNTGII